MNLSKYLILFTLVLTLVSIGSSHHLTFPDVTAEYGESVEVVINCDTDSDQCSDAYRSTYELYACGEEVDSVRGTFGVTSAETYEFEFDYPEDTVCDNDFGENEDAFELEAGTGPETGGTLTVEEAGDMEPHRGKYLVSGLNTDDQNIGDFFLTDDSSVPSTDYGSNEDERAQVHLRQYNSYSDDIGNAWAEPGNMLGTPGQLNDIISDCPIGSGSGAWTACNTVGEESFSHGWSTNYFNSVLLDDANSVSPVHSNGGQYFLDGEILVGYEPLRYDEDAEMVDESGDGPYFYVCREGAEMENGFEAYEGHPPRFFDETVPQVVDVNQPDTSISDPDDRKESDLYRCSYDEFQGSYGWTGVTECDSGLDHDADQRIDADNSNYQNSGGSQDYDEECDVSYEDKDPRATCPEGATMSEVEVVFGDEVDEVEMIVAQYYDDSEDMCNTDETLDEDSDDVLENFVEDREPGTFTCPTEQSDPFRGGSSNCDDLTWGPYEDEDGEKEMPMAYYPPSESYVEAMAEAQDLDLEDGDVLETGFVDDGWTVQYQSLYQAEMKYDGSASSSHCNQCHFPETWEDIILEWSVYDDDDVDNHEDAWEVREAGDDNTAVHTDIRPDMSEEEVFTGGFAPKCDEEESWQYDDLEGQWRCSGNIGWDQAVHLPELGGDMLGMMVMPYNALSEEEVEEDGMPEHVEDIGPDWRSYSMAVEDAEHREGSDELDELHAKCWPGTMSDKDTQIDEENYIEDSVPVQTSNPFGIYGEVDSTFGSVYTCQWGYTSDQHDEDYMIQDWSGVQNLAHDRDLFDAFSDEHDLSMSYTAHQFETQMQEWGN